MYYPEVSILEDEFINRAGVMLHVLRLDKLHPVTGGNKWFKLKGTIAKYQHLPLPERPFLISYGGCYSNLIAALAQAGP